MVAIIPHREHRQLSVLSELDPETFIYILVMQDDHEKEVRYATYFTHEDKLPQPIATLLQKLTRVDAARWHKS